MLEYLFEYLTLFSNVFLRLFRTTTRNKLCESLELSRCSPKSGKKEVLSSKLGAFFSARLFLATRVNKKCCKTIIWLSASSMGWAIKLLIVSSSQGNRTPVSAVRGRRLNRLTNEPYLHIIQCYHLNVNTFFNFFYFD